MRTRIGALVGAFALLFMLGMPAPRAAPVAPDTSLASQQATPGVGKAYYVYGRPYGYGYRRFYRPRPYWRRRFYGPRFYAPRPYWHRRRFWHRRFYRW